MSPNRPYLLARLVHGSLWTPWLYRSPRLLRFILTLCRLPPIRGLTRDRVPRQKEAFGDRLDQSETLSEIQSPSDEAGYVPGTDQQISSIFLCHDTLGPPFRLWTRIYDRLTGRG